MRSVLISAVFLIHITGSLPAEKETNLPFCYLGCFVDSLWRVLETELYESDDNSIGKCIKDCFNKGYNFSGTEDGDECWCGNEMTSNEKVPDSECHADECSGKKNEYCGGNWRISVYNECPPTCFGPGCTYRCNCKNKEQCHEVTGDCPTGCSHGWMGPGCQYRFSVEIGNTTDNLALCYKHAADIDREFTMNVYCVTPIVGNILEIKLAENEPPPLVLCEIEIFGGRLVSFNRTTWIAQRLPISDETCIEPVYNSTVLLENFYNIQGIGIRSSGRSGHVIAYSIGDSRATWVYEKETSHHHMIPIPGNIVTVEEELPGRGFCELDVFGECPLGKCGWECNITCMCSSQTTGISKLEGTCPYGCSEGWGGEGGTCNIKLQSCAKDTDNYGITWDSGIPGKYMRRSCPDGYKQGWVKRFCDDSGIYQDPVYNCRRAAIEDIYRKLLDENISGTSDILDELVDATSVDNTTDNNLMTGDLEVVNQIMKKITEVVEVNSADIDKTADLKHSSVQCQLCVAYLYTKVLSRIFASFVEVANNIIGEDTKKTWKILINETGSGADAVIDNLDLFIEKVATAKGANINTTVVAKSNLLVKLDTSAECEKNIHFPDRQHGDIPAWANATADSIDVPCIHENEMRPYSSVMYRDLSEILPSRTSDNRTATNINAPVISFTFYPRITGKLESPVEVTFELFDTTMENPSCTYWKKSNDSNAGSWSGDGCWLSKYDKKTNTVVCKCNHLTNFAVLMSPTSMKEKGHVVILSRLSMVGCITSMICLCLTLFIYLILRKHIKSFTAVITVNLALSLLMAYLLFLTGIDQTQNKDLCTAIAGLLHLTYLVVFFIMLTEGISLAYSVFKPLGTRRPVLPLLVASYVLPCMIVGVSMSVVQLEGYGNKNFCWLSTDSGLIWAFAIPVLTIISVNLVIIGLVIRKLCGTVAMLRKTDGERAKAGIRSVLVLMPVTGVTWVFGIFSVNEETVIFQYLFTIFNSLQGVLIFVFHCVMNKQIHEAFNRLLQEARRRSSQTFETRKESTELKVSKATDNK